MTGDVIPKKEILMAYIIIKLLPENPENFEKKIKIAKKRKF
jgi:hypothetical protein